MEYELELKIKELSLGEMSKVLLIKLILEESNVLLLDEPTRNMSSLSRPKLIEVLRDFKGCIISISHDLHFINEVCDSVYLLENERLTQIDKSEIYRE
jgi:ATPase subunit of ABC transporter with duplicated ATPase domains